MFILIMITHSAASLPKEAAIASRNDPLEAPAKEDPKIPLLLPVSEPEGPVCLVIVLSGELLDIAIGPGIVKCCFWMGLDEC